MNQTLAAFLRRAVLAGLALLSPIATSAAGVLASIPVGLGPSAVAINPMTDTLFVANETDDTVRTPCAVNANRRALHSIATAP